MNPTPRLALLTLTIGLLAACQTPTHKAPVEERSFGAKSSNYRPVTPGSPPVVEESRPDARGTYTVRRGDTLLRIALEYGQNYRDLVVWNNLADANDIRVGQVLRVAPSNTVVERSPGVTTSPISMPPSDTRPSTAAVVPKKPVPDKPVPDKPLAPVAPSRSGDAALPPPATAPLAGAGAPATSADEERVTWIWPTEGKVVGTFEEGKNKGVDIAGKLGQRVMAASAGKVMYAGSGIRGYGNLVIVKHSNSVLSAYAHNRAILVKEGDPVVKGQTIAEMGNSDSDSVKLHFEIRQQGKPVDPSRFLPSR